MLKCNEDYIKISSSLIHTSSVNCKLRAGRFRRTPNRSKPLTYEQSNPPDQIKTRKSWNAWNTGIVFKMKFFEYKNLQTIKNNLSISI